MEGEGMMELVNDIEIKINSKTSDGGHILLSRGNHGEIEIEMYQREGVDRNDVRVDQDELRKAIEIVIGIAKIDL